MKGHLLHIFLAVVLLGLRPLGLEAEDVVLPRYDVQDHCASVAAFGGRFSGSLQRCCLKTEKDARAYVSSIWNSIPDGIRQRCMLRAHFGSRGSYSLLKSCVEQTMQLRRVEMALKP